MAKTLGDALREARERAGISQLEAGEEAGVAPNMISRLESGERQDARFTTIARIARALDTSLDELAADCGLVPRRRGGAATRAVIPVEIAAELRRLSARMNELTEQVSNARRAPLGETKKRPRS